MAPPDLNENIESIKNDLFEKAMKGKWSEVADIYREKAKAHKAIITKSGDTALHIAVSDGQEEIVNELVDILISNGPSEGKEALAIENELGNTPLHVAASMGNVSMCQCIAQVDPSLVGARNKDSETPFFLAALHGQKQAFLCLLRICGPGACDDYSRRADGDTILHVAIAGDYFDLAFQIIHLFEDLVNSVNQQGFSPLHLLAGKPSAFKSGSSFGRCYNIIYHCIYVEELKVEVCDAQPLPITNPDDAKDPNYPKNYRTCVNFLRLFRNAVSVVFRKGKNGDLERQTAGQSGERVLEKQAQGGKNADLERQKEGHSGSQATNGAQSRQLFPDNYVCCHQFVKLAYKALLVVLGLGSAQIKKIHDKKQKHTWSRQIMNELLERASTNQHGNTGTKPLLGSTLMQADQGVTPPYSIDHPESSDFPEMEKQKSSTPDSLEANQKDKNEESDGKDMKGEVLLAGMNKPFGMAKNETTILITAKNGVTKIVERIQELFPVAIQDANAEKNVMLLTVQNKQPHESFIGMGKNPEMEKRETPILIAAKNGITEIVEKILELSPVAIHDRNAEKKNIVLLAVENRQPHVYQLLLDRKILRDSVFRVVDNEGNSALHLAAKLGEYKPWLIPGAALQMQWEIKWYEFVKESTTSHFFPRYNREGKTPKEIFTETHKNLVEKGGEWLNKTSESCSVVAALIATVAFATSATVPGGVKQDIGTPTLENQPAFDVFAISSLGALCFSVTSMVMFLSILTSRYQERDFGRDLPTKLLVGLTSLFVSIASMLISFCAGHFFVLKDKLKYAAFPVYAVTCLPVTFFAMVQFPLYFDLIWATFKKVPQRSYKTMPL